MKPSMILFFAIFLMASTFVFTQENNTRGLTSVPLVTTYLPTEYNGGIQNWGFDQDTSGYVYVANNYGLLEFDGATWNSYPIDTDTKTRSVLVDKKNNRIFIGGQKELGYFERTSSQLEYHSLNGSIPDEVAIDEVWDLIAYEEILYANLNGTILAIKDDSIQVVKELSEVEFIAVINHQLIAGSRNGIFIRKNNKAPFEKINDLQGIEYRGAIKSGTGFTLFTYDGSIYSLHDNQLQIIPSELSEFLAEAKINRVLELSNSNIVLATQNNGILILNPDLTPIQHLTKNKGLNHRTVVSLYEDNFNNLWVGLNNGICVIELWSPFSLINENVGLLGTGYVAEILEETVYLGTSSGLFKPRTNVKYNDETGFDLIKGSEGLVNNLSLLDDQIILSHHEGAFLLEDQQVTPFFDETGSWGFKKISPTTMIGGTYDGFALFNREELNVSAFNKLDGLKESARVFEFANDSILWMAHGYKGAFKITLRNDTIFQVEHYGKEEGFPSDILISVYKVANELVFTAETGVYQYNNEINQFEPHPFLNDWFKDQHVSKIKEVNGDQIYFIADGEMGVLTRKSIGIYKKEEKRFKKINRFISDDLENVNSINERDILIGAKEGFVLYQPELDIPVVQPFHAFLKSVTYTNLEDELKTIIGPFFKDSSLEKVKRIRFEYSAPYFDGLSDLKYAFRLKGYEKEWSDWQNQNWEEYTNLPSKTYVFEVKAMNVYGEESTVGSYPFTIEPRWYESNAALIAYTSFFLFFFSTVILIRERKHRNEKFDIHQSKEEELRSKEREISEFSEKKSQEIQALKNENLKKEIDHKNSQLASVTMHLLSKNEFVMSLRKRLNDSLDVKDNKDELGKIVKSIDKNIDEDEAWDTFVFHFDQVHGDFLKKIKQQIRLTPQETKLCAYLKMNMSTKDIANLMNITVRGVELARYRLRKKLGISRDVNLTNYLENYSENELA